MADTVDKMPESAAPAEKSLHQKTMHGLGWSTASSLINAAMVLSYTAVVTRLVEPSAFGVVAASGAILRFGGYFSDMGLSKAIVQKPTLTANDIRATFTSAIGLGFFFTSLFCLLAPLLAPLMLDDVALVDIIRLQSLTFFISSLNTVPTCLLKREMNFSRIAKTDIIAFILAYGLVGITLAYFGYGIYGIAISGMLSVLFTAIINYAFTRHSIALIFKKSAFKPMLGYGSRMSIISFIEFITGNIDILIIGRQLGSAMLGFYTRAQMLVQLPIYNITQSLSKVLFPAMASIQHDIPRLRRVYLSSITLLAFIIVPLGVGLSVAGREAILSVIGSKFEPAVPILQILAIMTPFRLMTHFGGIVCDSTGHLNVKIGTEIGFVVLNILALWFAGSTYGVIGICYALLVCEVLRFLAYTVILSGILEYPLGDFFIGLIPVCITAGFVGLSIAGIRYLLPATILNLPLIALGIEALGGGLGLLLGIIGPWSRSLRHQINDRFLSRSSLKSNRLVQVFVNL